MYKITAPGLYTDVPIADYFADPAPVPSLTQSMAKILLERSPLHAWYAHPRLGNGAREDDQTTAKTIGNVAHKLLLGRGRDVVIVDAADWRTKAAQERRDTALGEGLVPILGKHHARAVAMVKAAQEVLARLGLDLDGDTEAVIAWQEDGTWFRSMIDKLSVSRTIVLDYKTSGQNCAPHCIGKMMVEAGWDIQGAMHERGLDVLFPMGAGHRRHIFVAQENEPPYAVTVAELSETALTMGRKKLAVAVDIWRRCMMEGLWPGHPGEILTPEYPGYAESQWLDREQTEFAHRPDRTQGGNYDTLQEREMDTGDKFDRIMAG